MFARRRTLLLAALAAQVAVVQEVRADRGKATVTGIVRDANTGDPVSGALVVATSTALQGEQTVTTDSHGLYRLPNLPPGVYNLQFFAQSYNESRRSGVALTSDQRIRVDAGLETSTGGGDVRVVEVAAPTVDIGSAKVGQTIDEEFAKRVPIAAPSSQGGANRSFEAAAQVTPGARADAYGTSIAGTTSPENYYTVNGMNVGDSGYGLNGTPLTTEFIKEVKVAAGGYMPEYGRSTGGALNAVTKSGSNEFHGGAWAFLTPGGLEGKRTFPRVAGSTVLTEGKLGWIGDVGADLGGPLVKDRLWFYVGFSAARNTRNVRRSLTRRLLDLNAPSGFVVLDDDEDTPVTERIAGTAQNRKRTETTLQAIARFDLRVSKNHQLNVTGVAAPTFTRPSGLGAGTYEAFGTTNDALGGDVIVNWNASTNDKSWLFDTMVGYHNQQSADTAVDGSRLNSGRGLANLSRVIWQRNAPFRSITDFEELSGDAQAACRDGSRPAPTDDDPNATETLLTCPVTSYVSGGPGFMGEIKNERVRASHVITFFGEAAGHHEAKIGLDLEYFNYRNNRGYTGGRTLREFTSGNGFSDTRQYGLFADPETPVILPNIDRTSHSIIAGVFAQDSWSIMDRVTLNAGLRYDAQMLYGSDGELLMALPHQLAPRVGVVWDPTNRGKSKLYFNYGRFFQSVPLNIIDRAGSGEPQITQYWESEQSAGPTGCNPLTLEEQTGDCRDLENQYEFFGDAVPENSAYVVGAGKTPLDPNLKAQSQDEIVAGADYEIFPGGRLGVTYQRRWLNRAIEDMSRDEAETYFIGNPGEGSASDFPKAKRNYDAIIVQLQKNFSHNWMVAASYTASWLRGNIAGLFRPETGQLDPFANSDFDLVSLLPNRTGYLPGDQRHAIKLYAAGEATVSDRSAVFFGGAFKANSGQPTNFFGAHSLYGNDEVFILKRGSGPRLPWVYSVDTNFGYRYNFNKDVSLAFTVDIFNALNFQSITGRSGRYTTNTVLPIIGGSEADLETLTDVDGEPVVENPNFRRPTAYQRPRQIRFGLRLTF